MGPRNAILCPLATSIGERIRETGEKAGFDSQIARARALGVTQQRMNDLENDRYQAPDTKTLKHIAAIFGTTVEYLSNGITTYYQTKRTFDVEPETIDVSGHTINDIPVIAEGEASPQGELFWDDDGKLRSDVEDRISRPFDVRDPRAYGVKVRGDSMLPAYKPGMVLVVSPNMPVGNGDEVYVQLLNGERLIKIARRVDGGWLLESMNPAYEARYVKQAEIGSMHPVMWSRRKR